MVTSLHKLRKSRGFTLVELMIVIAIIAILVAVAAPIYSKAIVRTKEAALREDLFHLRQAIDQFTMDKQRAPQSLEELVSAGYLRELPKDPFTNAPDWVPVQEDVYNSIDQTQPGISDVHSGAPGTATDGTAYSSW